jgi:hypothetical protein
MTKTKVIIGTVVILALLAGVVALKGWYAELPKLTAQWTTAPEMKTATKIQKNKVAVKGIVVLDKKTAAKKLKLPASIAKDDNKQITATAEIPEYEGKTGVVAILDKSKENIEIIAKRQPLSLFGFTNKRAIGMRYGFNTVASTNTAAEIYGRWDFLRIGSAHVGLYGEATSTGDGKAMLNVEYRW